MRYRLEQTPCQSTYLSLSIFSKGVDSNTSGSGGIEIFDFGGGKGRGVPLDMIFPSAHHSPKTVNRNAKELVMGTVRLSSVRVKKKRGWLAGGSRVR